jgi:hypothetical protein
MNYTRDIIGCFIWTGMMGENQWCNTPAFMNFPFNATWDECQKHFKFCFYCLNELLAFFLVNQASRPRAGGQELKPDIVNRTDICLECST